MPSKYIRMKKLSAILIFLLIASAFTSCTDRRYSHLTGFRFQKKTEVVKVERSSQKDDNAAYSRSDKSGQAEYQAPDETVLKPSIGSVGMEPSQAMPAARIAESIANPSKLQKSKTGMSQQVANKTNHLIAKNNQMMKQVTPAPQQPKVIGTLIYWILVILLILLVLRLLEVILGPLFGVLLLVLLIVLIGRLLGIW